MMEALLAPVDIYCERLGAGFWAEPLNALSNAAFFLTAGLLAHTLRRTPDTACAVLALLIACIGLGSLAFHTVANGLTALLDVAFIGLFILAYIAVYTGRVYGFARRGQALCVAAFPTAVGLLSLLPLPIPAVYGASLAMLWGFALHARTPHLLAAACLFALALALRTLDMPLCPFIPPGTHFLWHLLNSAVLYCLVCAARDMRG